MRGTRGTAKEIPKEGLCRKVGRKPRGWCVMTLNGWTDLNEPQVGFEVDMVANSKNRLLKGE